MVSGGAGRRNGGADATAVVRLAGHPSSELEASVAREHEVAVGIDEARDDHRPPTSIMVSAAGASAAAHPGDSCRPRRRGRRWTDAEQVRAACVAGDQPPIPVTAVLIMLPLAGS
jgi:hypothetical protein